MTARTRNQAGFSLIELMVAMVVTLIITGAMYGLLAGGQSAFRREPELAERQQNARVGMSLIEQDIGAAGVGLPPFTQVFTPGLDGGGALPDILEIVVGSPGCPLTEVCVRGADLANDIVVETKVGLPNCAGAPAGGAATLGAVRFNNTTPATAIVGVVTNLGNPGNACGAAGGLGNVYGVVLNLNFAWGPPSWRHLGAPPPPAPPAPPVLAGQFVPVQVVRYVVATDPNDASNPGDPNFLHLWRSVTGGRSAGDNWANPQPIPGPEWQLVARGINDLQVTYVDGTGAGPQNSPTPIGAITDWNLLVRQVNVTLSSRVAGMNIAGFTGTDGVDATQIRLGQLTSQVSPRATLLALQDAGPAFEWK